MKILYKQPFDAINGCCNVSIYSSNCYDYTLKIQFEDIKTREQKQALLTFERCDGMKHTLSYHIRDWDNIDHYEQLIEIENSTWIKQVYNGLEKSKATKTEYKLASKLKHYAISFEDHGHFEFLAMNCIIEQQP